MATILRPQGWTGVHTHCRAFVRLAEHAGLRARLVTPFDSGPAVVYPSFGVGRLIKPFNKAAWVWWYRQAHYTILRQVLLWRMDARSPAIIYAQDPLSARAGLDLRDRGFPVEVVLAVHYNVSQADEWAEHGYIVRGGPVYRRIAALERGVLPRVDRLIFPSRYMLERVTEQISEIAGVPSWRIPNFVAGGEAGASGGPAGDLISLGTLDARKNHAFLLRVLAACHRRGRPYRLTIAGDGPLRSRLVALAEQLGVASAVDLAGYVRDAAALLPGYRAYVHAATIENCPIALMEAMAAGRPVFAAPVGGVPEMLTDGVEGRYWSLNDPETAATRLIEVLENDDLYARYSRAARRRYRLDYAQAAVGPRLLRVVLGEEDVRPEEGGNGERFGGASAAA